MLATQEPAKDIPPFLCNIFQVIHHTLCLDVELLFLLIHLLLNQDSKGENTALSNSSSKKLNNKMISSMYFDVFKMK